MRVLLDERAEETAKFVEYFNKFFDCLNVRNLMEGKHSRCPDKSPYRSSNDARLKVYPSYTSRQDNDIHILSVVVGRNLSTLP